MTLNKDYESLHFSWLVISQSFNQIYKRYRRECLTNSPIRIEKESVRSVSHVPCNLCTFFIPWMYSSIGNFLSTNADHYESINSYLTLTQVIRESLCSTYQCTSIYINNNNFWKWDFSQSLKYLETAIPFSRHSQQSYSKIEE